MTSKDSIALFFISLISLSGIFAILAFSPNTTGQVNLIETIMQLGQKKINDLSKNHIGDFYSTTKQQVQERPYKLEEKSEQVLSENADSLNKFIQGAWRPHTQNIAYDAGAVNAIKRPVTRWLTISEDNTWEFGSTGTWEVKEIIPEDWKRWGIPPHDVATKKIILYNWNENTADGPIDEGIEGVDFIWVIYHSEKLSLGPATIQIKFGH